MIQITCRAIIPVCLLVCLYPVLGGRILSDLIGLSGNVTIPSFVLDSGNTCQSFKSCAECGADTECQWCSMRFDVKQMTGRIAPEAAVYGSGVCRPKTSESCSKVGFGSLSELMKNDILQWMLSMSGFELSYSVVPLSPDTFDGARCNDSPQPTSLAIATCDECAELGAEYGWCHAELILHLEQLYVMDDDYTDVAPRTVSGAVCLQNAYHFLCQKDIFPVLPALANLPIDLRRFADFRTTLATTTDECRNPPSSVKLQKTSAVCDENQSCATCGDGCTWCGGILDVTASNVMAAPIGVNIFGKCIDGDDVTCSNIKFGTFSEVINSVPGASELIKFNVEKIDKATTNSDLTSEICTATEWPQVISMTCEECTKQKAGSTWCQTKLQLRPRGLVSWISGADYNATFALGLCLPKQMLPLCSFHIPSVLESSIIETSDACPA